MYLLLMSMTTRRSYSSNNSGLPSVLPACGIVVMYSTKVQIFVLMTVLIEPLHASTTFRYLHHIIIRNTRYSVFWRPSDITLIYNYYYIERKRISVSRGCSINVKFVVRWVNRKKKKIPNSSSKCAALPTVHHCESAFVNRSKGSV